MEFRERAKQLVAQMTKDEKASQMMHNSPAIPRLGIPFYGWWNEALHGVTRAGVATMFPQCIGQAATFDPDLIYKAADIISTEARAKHHEALRHDDRSIYKGLTFWTPNINIFRDPRWGRGQETFGEDPYLTGRLGVAYIKGLQGSDEKYLKCSACAKHFCAHSGPDATRGSFDSVVSMKDLFETYLPAFRECVTEGRVESVMSAYNALNGVPCTCNKWLLVDLLRDKWGFDGYVVSDCGAVNNIHGEHHYTQTGPESSAIAVNNGCDLTCGRALGNHMIAVQEGLMTDEALDRAVIDLFTTRMKLGMFDPPEEVPYASIPYELNDCPEHNAFAADMARKSLVLLKNDGLLPLDKSKLKTIAVIGPNADSRDALTGNYCPTPSRYATILDGVRSAVGDNVRIYYAQGCHLFKTKTEGSALDDNRIAEAISAAERADVVIYATGLDFTIEGEAGDTFNEYGSGDRSDLELRGRQQFLLEELHKTGKPVILVMLSGSANSVTWADENVPAIIQAWYPGATGGEAIASLIFGDYSPSGRLPVTFYRTTEELPDYNDYSMEGRTYRFMKNEALYPFGFGLSYTKFSYGDVHMEKASVAAGDAVKCTSSVKNIGSVESDEIVQLYIKDLEASTRVPRWKLAGTKRVTLKPGESAPVSFGISPEQMAVVDDDGNRIIEPGKFRAYVGGSQPDKRSEALVGAAVKFAEFDLTGDPIKLDE